jgi:hypothetical protein
LSPFWSNFITFDMEKFVFRISTWWRGQSRSKATFLWLSPLTGSPIAHLSGNCLSIILAELSNERLQFDISISRKWLAHYLWFWTFSGLRDSIFEQHSGICLPFKNLVLVCVMTQGVTVWNWLARDEFW